MLIDSKRHFMVINRPKAYRISEFIYDVVQCLSIRLHGVKYIGICHNKDLNENNELKTIHIHLYLEFPKKVTTQKIIREFSEYWGMDSSNLISDMSVYSVNACVRYLLHLDDMDKYKYLERDLFYSDDHMLELLNQDFETLDIENLYDVVISSKHLLEVYSRIGLNLSSRYRNVIIDVWRHRKYLVNENFY